MESGWDLWMYRHMQRHWLEQGPPVYLSVARYLGHRPPPGTDTESSQEDPAALAAFLSSFPGGRVI